MAYGAYLEHASYMFIFMLRSQGSLCEMSMSFFVSDSVSVFFFYSMSLITDRTVSSQGLRKLPENVCRSR